LHRSRPSVIAWGYAAPPLCHPGLQPRITKRPINLIGHAAPSDRSSNEKLLMKGKLTIKVSLDVAKIIVALTAAIYCLHDIGLL
jgi:hypothetical protein